MNDQFKTDCLAILSLAMETPETKAQIMCGWVAHCGFFQVRVYLGGWSEKKADLSAECHDLTSKRYTPEFHTEPAKVLEQIKALLA